MCVYTSGVTHIPPGEKDEQKSRLKVVSYVSGIPSLTEDLGNKMGIIYVRCAQKEG